MTTRRRRSQIMVPNNIDECDSPASKKQKTAILSGANDTTTAAPGSPSKDSPSPSKKLRIKINSPFRMKQRTVTLTPQTSELDFPSLDPSLLDPTPLEQLWKLDNHYRLQKLLGEGAFGRVYEAVRISDDQLVALKVLPKHNSTEAEVEREIHALKALSTPGHEHVCKLYHHHQDENNVYLAMEYIVGGAELFEHLVEKGPFSEKDAARFLQEFARGLGYIHSKGYSHGDLKPENLLMSNKTSPCVKIVDFGFCVPNDSPTKMLFGTVAYLAPEISQYPGITQGPTQGPTPEADMYAVGVITYTLLTGTHPFDRTNCASDYSIRSAVVNSLRQAQQKQTDCWSPCYLTQHVFDDRVAHISPSGIDLMRKLLEPVPSKRMTSSELQNHPWIRGRTCRNETMADSDTKLRRFWQRRFRAAIVKKFHIKGSNWNGDDNDKALRAIYYDSMDTSGDGKVSFDEFKDAMKDIFGISQLKEIFDSVDLDKNGYLDYDEFVSIMNTLFETKSTTLDRAISRAESLNVSAMSAVARTKSMTTSLATTAAACAAAAAAGVDGDDTMGTTSATPMRRRSTKTGIGSEILRQFGRRKSNVSQQELQAIFSLLDEDQSGTVEISELKSFFEEDEDNEKQLAAIFEWADDVDRDLNGSICFDEFCTAMTRNKQT